MDSALVSLTGFTTVRKPNSSQSRRYGSLITSIVAQGVLCIWTLHIFLLELFNLELQIPSIIDVMARAL